jgi:hypothetical protein
MDLRQFDRHPFYRNLSKTGLRRSSVKGTSAVWKLSIVAKWLAGSLVVAVASAQGLPDVSRFEVEGIRLGMPLKEAMAALRMHNANLRLAPDSVPYPGLPSPLTYGINAVGGGEGFYFLVTMPPNELTVSRITWVRHFAADVIPKQDAVVASLAQKYGRISWDTTSAALMIGTRDVFWILDEQGNPIPGQPSPRCLGQSTFFMNGLKPGSRNQWDPVNVRLPPVAARLRIEQGFVNREDPIAEECSKYSMVHARLFKASMMGVAVPNLVDYVVLMVSSGPMDRQATEATHQYWLKTAKSIPAGAGKKGD